MIPHAAPLMVALSAMILPAALSTQALLMEIPNDATGPASEKPALYVDGGIQRRPAPVLLQAR